MTVAPSAPACPAPAGEPTPPSGANPSIGGTSLPAGAGGAPRPHAAAQAWAGPVARPSGAKGEARRPRILIADPSRLQCRLLESQISRWGYEVRVAGSAVEALGAIRPAGIDIVLSDWSLSDRSGVDLCRAVRALGEPYVYFILLCARSGPGRIAEGLNAGADDFLAKPATAEELAARIGAGARLLAAQRALSHAHAETDRALAEARTLAGRIDRDLDDARRLQRSLMPPREAHVGGLDVAARVSMSGRVGGDLLGWTTDPRGGVSFYAVDVSGHGIASALLAARIKGALSGECGDEPRATSLRSPEPHCVVARLNDAVRGEIGTDHYFTLLHARCEPAAGRLRYVQAGHPRPLLLRAGGGSVFLGEGGLPVGLVDGARWRRREVRLAPGDRLLIHSDGVTECEAPDGHLLDEDGLLALTDPIRDRRGLPFLESILDGLRRHSGRSQFADDVSMLVVDVPG